MTQKQSKRFIRCLEGKQTNQNGLLTEPEVSDLHLLFSAWDLLIRVAPYSIVSTPEHDMHRRRRNGLNSFFSIASVRRMEPIIHENIKKMLQRLELAKERGANVQVHRVFKACASDIITTYALNSSLNFLDMDDYGQAWFDSTDIFFYFTHIFAVFPWFVRLVQFAPSFIVESVVPSLRYLQLRQMVRLYD